MIKAINKISSQEPFSTHGQFLMKMRLDCVRIQSHQFIHGTSVPKYLLLICKNFVYDAYCHRIKTIVKGSFQNPITYIKRWLHIQEAI